MVRIEFAKEPFEEARAVGGKGANMGLEVPKMYSRTRSVVKEKRERDRFPANVEDVQVELVVEFVMKSWCLCFVSDKS